MLILLELLVHTKSSKLEWKANGPGIVLPQVALIMYFLQLHSFFLSNYSNLSHLERNKIMMYYVTCFLLLNSMPWSDRCADSKSSIYSESETREKQEKETQIKYLNKKVSNTLNDAGDAKSGDLISNHEYYKSLKNVCSNS